MAKINANNQRTSWQYDEANHKINEYDADGGTRTMTYDGVGSLKSNIDPRNQGASNMGYDANNRLTGESFTDGTNHSYGYDNVGNRLTMGDSTGMTTFTYTARNELQTTQVPAGGMMTHSYDAAGRRTNMHDYSGANPGTVTGQSPIKWARNRHVVGWPGAAVAATGFFFHSPRCTLPLFAFREAELPIPRRRNRVS
jgi:YD repeat-containing protein